MNNLKSQDIVLAAVIDAFNNKKVTPTISARDMGGSAYWEYKDQEGVDQALRELENIYDYDFDVINKITLSDLAEFMGVSKSVIHASLRRLNDVNIISKTPYHLCQYAVHTEVFINLLIHGVPYFFPAKKGSIVRGIRTSTDSPLMEKELKHDDMGFVWPYISNNTGISLSPIHKSVPIVSLKSFHLYCLFGALDSIRVGKPRERAMAEKNVEALLKGQINAEE